jgi:hypothetical protein
MIELASGDYLRMRARSIYLVESELRQTEALWSALLISGSSKLI